MHDRDSRSATYQVMNEAVGDKGATAIAPGVFEAGGKQLMLIFMLGSVHFKCKLVYSYLCLE
jgi:hypothetical protein